MFITKTQFLRYHPTSFIDSYNNILISRDEMVSLLNSNATIGKFISEQVYDQKTIIPYFDCDMDGHSSDTNEINSTIKHIQDTIRDLLRPVCVY